MTLNNTPFFLRPKLAIDVTVKAAREASIQAQARKMQLNNQLQQKPAHKSIFGKAIKLAAGIVPDPVENAVGDTVGGVEKGLNFWGNQVQSVPAALFTKGTVQNGQYTTKRNIIGNPLANVASHVKAQREAGVAPKSGGGLLGDIGAGFASARLAGEAFNADPDISPVTKNVTGLAFDPTTYLAAGTLSKIPKIAAVGGAKGKLLRGGLGLAEGFDSPATVGKFIAGTAVGTAVGEKLGHPNIGGFVGGGLALAGAKKPGAKNALTEVVTDEERLHHATPNVIREGEIVTSPRGDIGAGHYTAKDPNHVEGYVEGDPANVTRFTDEHQRELRDKINTQGGQQVYRYKPTRDLFLLNWNQPIDQVEASRINNVLKKRGLSHRVAEGMSGGDVYNSFKDNEITPNGNTSNVTGVLGDAGFDGMTDGFSQYTIWRPNEVLKADLTPPEGYVPMRRGEKATLPDGQQLTESQMEKFDEFSYNNPDYDPEKILQYFKDHTDSYGDKLPGHPTINEFLALADNEKVKSSFDTPVKYDSTKYNEMYNSLSPKEVEKYHELLDNKPNMVSASDDEWMQFLTDFHNAVKGGPEVPVKPAGAIPDVSELNPIHVKAIKEAGHLKNGAGTAADLSLYSEMPESIKNYYKSLEWGDANGYLDAAGKKQFDYVIKKMDELEPIKSINYLSTKESSDKLIKKYGYYPNMGNEPFNAWHYLSSDELKAVIDSLEEYDSYGALSPEGVSQIGAAKNIFSEKFGTPKTPNVAKAVQSDKGLTWTVAGKQINKNTLDKYTPLSSEQKKLVNKLANNLPNESMAAIIDSVSKGTDTNGNWNEVGNWSWKPKPEKPVSPEDIIGNLDAAGKKQFDDVLKKMDKIEPTKGVQALLDQGFVKSPEHSILYKYDPATETLQAEGKTFVATKLNGEWVTHLDDGTKVTGISIGNLVDEIDMWDGFYTPNIQAGKPNIASAIKPVSPEDIIGNLDQKPKSVDEFVKYTEDTLGKPYENKDYPAQGQPGAPIAGQSISTKSVTPVKGKDGLWSAGPFNGYEDLGDLIDEAAKTGYKVNPPEGFGPTIAGGAAPEVLVKPREITVGLTPGEKISNALTKVKKAIFDHGVENNAIATPIAKEYIRINNVMKVQATNLGKLAQRAEKVLGITDVLNVDTSKFTPEQRAVMENLQRHMEAFDETLNQFDTKFDDIHTFAEKIRSEQGGEKKRFSDILTEYANAISNKVSDKWLAGQINRLGDTVSMANEAGIPIPGKTVNLAGAKETKLPQEIADVLTGAVHRVHPTKDSEFTSLFNAVNNTLRSMWAAGDASFQMIQQLPTWADNPKAAAKATLAGFHTLTDQTAMADFIAKHDKAVYGTGKPTVTEMISHGGYIAESLGGGTDLGGLAGKIERLPGYGKFLKKSNTLFTETGNANRIMIWDYLYDQYKNGGIDALNSIPGIKTNAQKGMTRDQILDAIAAAGNRATGYSEHAFGGPYGSALFFAPRFMQSQIETVMKAAWGGGVENQVARRQLLKLVAIGTGITVAANAARGKETDFDPRSSNFMRIRDVAGSDLSVFGPWDTLVKGLVRSVPHVDQNGDFTVGEPQYLLRSKLSPVLSTTVDTIKGTNVIGQDTSNLDMTQLKNLLLPFSLRKVGEEPASASIFGFFGGKGSPLSANEVLDNKLSNAGIKQSDPDYLIKRRDYLAAHPEDVPKATGDKFRQAQEIQKDIASRRKLNDDKALSSAQTLTDFRDNRTKLLKEQRDRLGEVLKGDANKGSTQQKKWLNSYFQLFDNPDTKDPITGDINGDKFDEAVAKWTNENGNTALDFVARYMGAGLNQVESQYYKDLQTLDKAGYFKMPKYQNMKSNLTEDEISSLAQLVDSARVSDPRLQSQPWATTAKRVLGHSIDHTELMDVIHSRLDKYANPDRAKLKDQYAKELLWFNPRADWNSYINYKPGQKKSKGVGSLKVNLKPQLK